MATTAMALVKTWTGMNWKQYYCQTTGSQRQRNVLKLESPDWSHAKQGTSMHA